ncbi:MAG TPA: hypothetical protein ENJ79_10645 [Gammaproteobacteria bacterium]|nr:hypothetical protein [Gammaproteobacteria bacterium]
MHRIRFMFPILMALAGGLPAAAAADTLVVDAVQAAPATDRPARGLSMQQVLNRWGEPVRRDGPVGDPPISHWTYPDFVVYFEADRVIHSVVPRTANSDH